MGEVLAEFHLDLGHCPNPAVIPNFFMNLAEIVTDSQLSGVVTVNNWQQMTNKILYSSYISQFPQTKVEDSLLRSIPETWRRICSPSISSSIRESLFLLIHNKLSIRDRLFRVGLRNDPYCSTCLDAGIAFNCDREHYFCSCEKVKDIWKIVRDMLTSISPAGFTSLKPTFNGSHWIFLKRERI